MNNDITDITGPVGGTEVGIILSNFSTTAGAFLVVNNRITGASTGINFEPTATGKYRDNLTSGVATPFSGGTDAGNNN